MSGLLTLPFPATFCGDYVLPRTVLLAFVPQDAAGGAQVRALHLLAGETLVADGNSFWIAQIGTISTGTFKVARQTSLSGGIVAEVGVTIPYLDPVLVSREDRLALRLAKTGAPPPLVGLSACVEWGVLASRR